MIWGIILLLMIYYIIKRGYKQKKILLLIEAGCLFLSVIVAFLSYQLIYTYKQKEVSTKLTSLKEQLSTILEEPQNIHPKMVENYYSLLFLAENKSIKQPFVFKMLEYTQDGKLISELDSSKSTLLIDNQFYALENYFDQSELQEINQYALLSHHEITQLYGNELNGQIEGIMLGNHLIGKDDQSMQDHEIEYLSVYSTYQIVNTLNATMNSPSYELAPSKLFHTSYPYSRMITNSNEIEGLFSDGNTIFAFGILVDTRRLVLSSPHFIHTMINSIGLIECIGLVCYVLLCKNVKMKEEMNQERTTFMNVIAHEMKTPTAIMMNAAEMIYYHLDPSHNQQYHQMIYDQSVYMNELLLDMIDYVNTSKDQTIEKEVIDLKPFIEEILSKINHDEIMIDSKIERYHYLVANYHFMYLALYNLLQSAIEYCDGHIVIEYDQNEFKVSYEGKVLTKKQMQHIFEPFYEVDLNKDLNRSSISLAIFANCIALHHMKYGILQKENVITIYFKTK